MTFLAKIIIAAAIFLADASAACPQPFGSRDEVAAKNIFLVSAAALNCDNFTPVAARIAEYARQNAVDIEAFKNPEGKYKGRRQYAIQIVNSHAQIASMASLCRAIVQDFGPRGTLIAPMRRRANEANGAGAGRGFAVGRGGGSEPDGAEGREPVAFAPRRRINDAPPTRPCPRHLLACG